MPSISAGRWPRRWQNGAAKDLLASYETERRPVHERTIAEAVHNFGRTAVRSSGPTSKRRAGRRSHAQRGGRSDRGDQGARIQDARHRARHALHELADHRCRRQRAAAGTFRDCTCPRRILDVWRLIFGWPTCHRFTITSGRASQFWSPTAMQAPRTASPRPRQRRAFLSRCWRTMDARLRERYEAKFALIRPDQHVAWRGSDLPTDWDGLFARVTGAKSKV